MHRVEAEGRARRRAGRRAGRERAMRTTRRRDCRPRRSGCRRGPRGRCSRRSRTCGRAASPPMIPAGTRQSERARRSPTAPTTATRSTRASAPAVGRETCAGRSQKRSAPSPASQTGKRSMIFGPSTGMAKTIASIASASGAKNMTVAEHVEPDLAGEAPVAARWRAASRTGTRSDWLRKLSVSATSRHHGWG